MPSIDSIISTLHTIRTKVRRLTRSPSTSQLTFDQLDDYINTFILYDFPEFTVDNKLVFFTMPNVDVYGTNTINETDPLFNFKNVYLSVSTPVYVAGQQIELSQSRDQFFRRYNGLTIAFAGRLAQVPMLPRKVTFSSIDFEGNGIALVDVPLVDPISGIILQTGDIVQPDSEVVVGGIGYLTGDYNFNFPAASPPGNGKDIVAQTFTYAAGRPTAVLFEDHKFTFRPVPDKTYRVEIDAFKRPTELLINDQTPEISQWWQYIAYGAAKKVFEDRMDVESVQAIMPEFMRQRSLVLQKLVVQQSSERTATIYSDSGGAFNGSTDNK